MNTFESKKLGFNAEFEYTVEAGEIFIHMWALQMKDKSWVSFDPVLVHWDAAPDLYAHVEKILKENESYNRAVRRGYDG
jgi:hypothetical protein